MNTTHTGQIEDHRVFEGDGAADACIPDSWHELAHNAGFVKIICCAHRSLLSNSSCMIPELVCTWLCDLPMCMCMLMGEARLSSSRRTSAS